MRRLVVLLLLISATALGGTVLFAPVPAAAQLPPEDPRRGLVYKGLRPSTPTGACPGNFEIETPASAARVGRPSCTHGPDPAPPGVDVRQRRDPVQVEEDAAVPGEPTTAAATTGIQCIDDGTSGNRVQLVYAHAADVPSRLAEWRASFVQTAADVDANINASAAETGGVRHVRYVHDSACNPVILDVTLSKTGDDNFDNTVLEMENLGHNRADRKYLIWVDANLLCGIGHLYDDERPGQENYNNGAAPLHARVDNGCWARQGGAYETHELTHTLGGVQLGAPNATSLHHCTDEADRMCYADGSGEALVQVCGYWHENRLDCAHDDYFSTAPAPGAYLATKWNLANSSFLTTTGPAFIAPPHIPADFDGDAKTNPSVFRPATGAWFSRTAGGSSLTASYGTNGDIAVPSDYDGDGKNDLGVFRPSSGVWFVDWTGSTTSFSVAYGTSTDIPVPADYNDDGRSEVAVFRPSTGAWYMRLSSGGHSYASWGTNGDIPVPNDYDGDGRADVAVFRPSSSTWFLLLSTGGQITLAYGTTGDIPVPGDYNGDAKADIAVFRPSSGTWFVRLTGGGEMSAGYGTSGDIPVPGRYDSDAKTDFAVFRPGSGTWFIRQSGGGDLAFAYGTNGDAPLPLPAAIRRAFFP